MSSKPLPIKIIHYLLISIVFAIPLFFTKQFVFPFTQGKTFLFFLLIEISTALWLYVVLAQKSYLPTRHPILLAGGIFLLFYTISGILGIDPAISFGSSISRMSGLILIYHAAMLVVLLVSTVRDNQTWNRILTTTVLSGTIVAIASYLLDFGLITFPANPLGGSTIGNSSYAGAYLLFAFFFALLLLNNATKTRRVFMVIMAAIIFFCPILFNVRGIGDILHNPLGVLGSARAATGSLWIGLLIYGLFLLSTSLKKYLRYPGRVGFTLLITILGMFIVTLPFSTSMYGNLSGRKDLGPRFVFWDSALKGIAERPLLGWGPENYFAPFYKYFNPLLMTDDYGGGGEANSDKPHNTYLEVAVSGGIFSLISYLTLLYLLFSSLVKARLKNKISQAQLAALLGLLAGYLLQNSFFFDTITSYIAISLIIGYAVYLTLEGVENEYPRLSKHISWSALLVTLTLFLLVFYNLSYKPYRQQATLVYILEEAAVTQRSGSYTQLFSATPYGRTSLMTYVINKMITIIPDLFTTLDPEQKPMVIEDVHNLRVEVENYMGTAPTHYRLVLSLVRLLRLEYTLQADITKGKDILNLSDKYLEYLPVLSPANPQNVWEQEWVEASRNSF